MTNKIFSVSHDTQVDLTDGSITSDVYVRVYTSMFTTGLVAFIGATNFTTLMALSSYMDAKGECYPTLVQLGNAIGVHEKTVGRYVNELLEVRVDGKPLVTRKKVNKGRKENYSVYTIHPLSQLAKFTGSITPINAELTGSDTGNATGNSTGNSTGNTVTTEIRSNNTKSNKNKNQSKTSELKFTARDALNLFQEIYYDVYSVNYVVSNYAKETKIMRDKVVVPFPEQAKQIIEIAVRQYETRWKTAKFPRPSVGMMSWVVNSILEDIEAEKGISQALEGSEDAMKLAEQKMLEKLKKMEG